jgi:D-glycerate 3-kinase
MDPQAHPLHHPRGYASGFVQRVLDDAVQSGARCYGIAGLQGSGKSTLAHQVAALAARHGRSVAVLSIDDFYLDRPEREALARGVHPLLGTRGPPGTHDLTLACNVLDALREGRGVALPRFDKLADRRLPRTRWTAPLQAGLVIFEGWFNQVPAQLPHQLASPLNALERDEDPKRVWRSYCNDALITDYPALWQRIDRALFLQPPGFEVVPGWRWQQEQALQAANPGCRAMTQNQVNRFVQCFERVSRQALRTLDAVADWTVRLDAERRPID